MFIFVFAYLFIRVLTNMLASNSIIVLACDSTNIFTSDSANKFTHDLDNMFTSELENGILWFGQKVCEWSWLVKMLALYQEYDTRS